MVLDRLVSLDGLALTAKPGSYNEEGNCCFVDSTDLVVEQTHKVTQYSFSPVKCEQQVLLRYCRCWNKKENILHLYHLW